MFEVDIKGLRQIIERKGKGFALLEVIQNSWDQNVTKVDITFTKDSGDRRAYLRVEDDDPDGFADLRHAYTLFAPSTKKANPTQRGRFNIGEKLVIALCKVASIRTTTGGLEFAEGERRTLRGGNAKTERGSIFEGEIVMNNDEFAECCDLIAQLLPPAGIQTYFNGDLLNVRHPFKVIERSLRTEIADSEGFLRAATRQTAVHIHRALAGESSMLFEMGIPVVETEIAGYHVDVQQKVPLTMDRDNVPPAYLRTIRTIVLNEVSRDLTTETVTETWVTEALESPDVDPGAVKDVIVKRFGEKAVIYDLSDPEANNRAQSAGYTVVSGGSLSGAAWKNVRNAGALVPAGHVTPSPKPYKGDGDEPFKIIQPRAEELPVINGIKRICKALLGFDVTITLVSDVNMTAAAMYGGRRITFNKLRCGRGFFINGITEAVVDLTLHEIGHEFSGNHGSDEYNNALTRLAAKLAFLVKADPTLLEA